MRRLFILLFLAASACAGARAQSPQQPTPPDEEHGLAVVKFGWERRMLARQGTHFGRVDDTPNETGDTAALNATRAQGARRAVFQVEANRMERDARTSEPARGHAGDEPPRFAFRYVATFQNRGARAVSSIDWEYVFRDPATREELGRHRFTCGSRLAPGRKRESSFLVLDPPSRTVRAGAPGKGERQGVEGSVVVVRVVYADGTVWRRR